MDNILTADNLNSLYEKLAEPLAPEAIQFAETRAYKGYDSTGYSYQMVCNRMNEVLGISHWRIIHEILNKESTGKLIDVTIHLSIQIGNWRLLDNGESIFEVLAERDCYGGHQSKLLCDGLKGAFTNSLKKCAALFGAGRQAYEGTLDDDFVNPDGVTEGKINYSPSSSSYSKTPVKQVAQLPVEDAGSNNVGSAGVPNPAEEKNGPMLPGQERSIKLLMGNVKRKKDKGELQDLNLDSEYANYGVDKWEDLSEGQAAEFFTNISAIVRKR